MIELTPGRGRTLGIVVTWLHEAPRRPEVAFDGRQERSSRRGRRDTVSRPIESSRTAAGGAAERRLHDAAPGNVEDLTLPSVRPTCRPSFAAFGWKTF